jgi:hypothetical protein
VTAQPIGLRVVPIRTKAVESWQTYTPDDKDRDRLEAALAAALSHLASRWVDRTITRVESPQQRKGTRHWVPEYEHDTRVGTKALDAAKATDEEAAPDDAQSASEPVISPAAIAAAAALYVALSGEDQEPDSSMLALITAGIVETVLALIAESAARQIQLLGDLINSLDQSGADMPAIREAVLAHYPAMQEWAKGLAVQAATATVEGARQAAADHIAEADQSVDVLRRWRSRRDEKVRPSHAKADGQEQPLGTPFTVGGALLRFPGDPRAPYRETANCRCRVDWRSKRTGQFLPQSREGKTIEMKLTHTGYTTVRVGTASYEWKPDEHPRDRHGKFISKGGEVRTLAGDVAKVLNVVDRNHVQIEHANGKTETVSRTDVTVTKAGGGGAPHGDVSKVGKRVASRPDHPLMPSHTDPAAPDSHHPHAVGAPPESAAHADHIAHLRQTVGQAPQPLDAQHAADIARAASDVGVRERRLAAAHDAHAMTDRQLPADHPNRAAVLKAGRDLIGTNEANLRAALMHQRITHDPHEYATHRVVNANRSIRNGPRHAGTRQATSKQTGHLSGLVDDVVKPNHPDLAAELHAHRGAWNDATVGQAIDVLKAAKDRPRVTDSHEPKAVTDMTPGEATAEAQRLARKPDKTPDERTRMLAAEHVARGPQAVTPTIAGIHPVGARVTIQHDGHPRDGQTVTITGATGATGGSGGGGTVNTDQGAISRHTRVVPATDSGTPGGAPPQTEQDAAGLYDLAAQFEGDGNDSYRVAVADALRDFADAQTYGNEDDKAQAEGALTGSLDSLDEQNPDDAVTQRLVANARDATRAVPVAPGSPQDAADYQGSHLPSLDGPSLDNLLATDSGGGMVTSADFYDNMHFHKYGDPEMGYDDESEAAIRAARGNPEALVTIYRAAPPGVTHINPGDWVTLSQTYAQQHAINDDNPANDWPVYSTRVRAGDIRWDGNDINEFGFGGPQSVPASTPAPQTDVPGTPTNVLPDRYPPGTLNRGMVINVPPEYARRMLNGDITADEIVHGILGGQAGRYWADADTHNPEDSADSFAYTDENLAHEDSLGEDSRLDELGSQAGLILVADEVAPDNHVEPQHIFDDYGVLQDGTTLSLQTLYYSPDGGDNWHTLDASGLSVVSEPGDDAPVMSAPPADVAIRDLKAGDHVMLPGPQGDVAAHVDAVGRDDDEPDMIRVDYTHPDGTKDSLYADPTMLVTPAEIDRRPNPQPSPGPRQPGTVGELQAGDTVMLPLGQPTPVTIANAEPYGENGDIVNLTYRRQGAAEEETMPFGTAIEVQPFTPAPPGPQPTGRVALRTYQRRMIHGYELHKTHADPQVRNAAHKLLNYQSLNRNEAQAMAAALRDEAQRSGTRRAGALNRAALSFDALDNHLLHGGGQGTRAHDVQAGQWARFGDVYGKVTETTRSQGGRIVNFAVTDAAGRAHNVSVMRGTNLAVDAGPAEDPTVQPDPVEGDPTADDSKSQLGTISQISAGMYVTIPGSEATAKALGVDPSSLDVTGKVVRVRRSRNVGAIRGAIEVHVETADGIRADNYVGGRSVWIHPQPPDPKPIVDEKPDKSQGEKAINHNEIQVGDRIRITNSTTGQEFVGTVHNVSPTEGFDEGTGKSIAGTEIGLQEDGQRAWYTHTVYDGDVKPVLLSREPGAAEALEQQRQDGETHRSANIMAMAIARALNDQRAAMLTDISLAQGNGRGWILDAVFDAQHRDRRTAVNGYGYAVNDLNSELTPRSINLDSATRRAIANSLGDRSKSIVSEALTRQYDVIRNALADAKPLDGEADHQMVGRVMEQIRSNPPTVDYTEAMLPLARAKTALKSANVGTFTYVPTDEERAAAEQRVRNALLSARREALEKFKTHLDSDLGKSGGALPTLANKWDGVPLARLVQQGDFQPSPRWAAAVIAGQSFGQDAGRTASLRKNADTMVREAYRNALTDSLAEMRSKTTVAGTNSPLYSESLGALFDRMATGPDSRAQDIIDGRAQQLTNEAADHLAGGGDRIDANKPDEALPEPGGDWKDRVAAWQAMLPSDPDKFGQREMQVSTLGDFTLADLEAGKTPEIITENQHVADRAADDGPGETAMRHLHALRQVGAAMQEEYGRRLAEALPDMGGNPERYIEGLDQQSDAAYKSMTQLDRDARDVRKQVAQPFLDRAWDEGRGSEISGAPDERNLRNRVSLLRHFIDQSSRTGADSRDDVAEYQRLTAISNEMRDALVAAEEPGGALEGLNRRREAQREMWMTTRGQREEAKVRIREARANAARDVLREIRPVGTPPGGGMAYSTGERAQSVKALRWAEQWYPSDWLTAERARSLGAFKVRGTARGHYAVATREIAISGGSPDEKNKVAVHELGHHMERVVPGLVAAEDAFLWSRTSTGAVGARSRETVSRIYSGPKEVGRKDKFKSHYTGKDYGRGDAHEVFTTGIESLFGGSDYLDEDMRNFMFGTLASLGRDSNPPSKSRGVAGARTVTGQYGEVRITSDLGGSFAVTGGGAATPLAAAPGPNRPGATPGSVEPAVAVPVDYIGMGAPLDPSVQALLSSGLGTAAHPADLNLSPDGEQARTQAKTEVYAAIAARMVTVPDASLLGQDTVASLSGSRWSSETADDGTVEFFSDAAGEFEPGDETVRTALRRDAVSRLVQRWSMTSNDSDADALALQEIAVDEFGLPGAAPWTLGADVRTRVDAIKAEREAVLRTFLRAQYEETQARLAAAGITQVTLYRGMHFSDPADVPEEDFPPAPVWATHGTTTSIDMRPLSSFSADRGAAQQFADTSEGVGVVLAGTVPATRILSMPRSGMGDLTASEFVVLAGPGEWRVSAWNQSGDERTPRLRVAA